METLVLHIAFYYKEERLEYIHKIIDESYRYLFSSVDIFIHTNEEFELKDCVNDSVRVNVIVHELEHPFALTWLCRDLMLEQKNLYDAFMYIEDDILVPKEAINYWQELSSELKKVNCNLGFVRIEIKDGIEYITDLQENQSLTDFITINETHRYAINNKNPYCAFWIYSKEEFQNFISSPFYDVNNITNYGLRERCAIGLHGLGMNYYDATLIPCDDNGLDKRCRIYHLPNNYVNDINSVFAKVKFSKGCIL